MEAIVLWSLRSWSGRCDSAPGSNIRSSCIRSFLSRTRLSRTISKTSGLNALCPRVHYGCKSPSAEQCVALNAQQTVADERCGEPIDGLTRDARLGHQLAH